MSDHEPTTSELAQLLVRRTNAAPPFQPEAWSRPCPTCDATIGDPCVSATGIRASTEHAARRGLRATQGQGTRLPCPECAATRLNEETLRVHRAIAHEVTR